MQVKIIKISRTPRVSKSTGKQFTSLGLQVQEYGDKWLSGFDGPLTQNWKEGDTVEIEVETKGDYLNFKLPKISPPKNLDLAKIEAMLSEALTRLGRIENLVTTTTSDGNPMPSF